MQIQYSTLSPTAIITAAEWPEWMNLPESEKQPWLDAKWARLTSPIEPADDDYTPTAIDIEQNAGPCLVTICADTSGDDWNGYLGRIECWDVIADVNSPQFSEVG